MLIPVAILTYASPSLAIGVIPESLIAVLTITMATGTSRMAKSHVVVRQLNALEGEQSPDHINCHMCKALGRHGSVGSCHRYLLR